MQKTSNPLKNPFLTIPTAALLGFGSVEANLNKAIAVPVRFGEGCDLIQNVKIQYQIRDSRKIYSECRSKVTNLNPYNGKYDYAGSGSLPKETIGASIATYINEPGKVCVFVNGRTKHDPSISLLTNYSSRDFFNPIKVEGANIDYIIPENGIVELRARMNPDLNYPKQISIGSGNQCN